MEDLPARNNLCTSLAIIHQVLRLSPLPVAPRHGLPVWTGMRHSPNTGMTARPSLDEAQRSNDERPPVSQGGKCGGRPAPSIGAGRSCPPKLPGIRAGPPNATSRGFERRPPSPGTAARGVVPRPLTIHNTRPISPKIRSKSRILGADPPHHPPKPAKTQRNQAPGAYPAAAGVWHHSHASGTMQRGCGTARMQTGPLSACGGTWRAICSHPLLHGGRDGFRAVLLPVLGRKPPRIPDVPPQHGRPGAEPVYDKSLLGLDHRAAPAPGDHLVAGVRIVHRVGCHDPGSAGDAFVHLPECR